MNIPKAISPHRLSELLSSNIAPMEEEVQILQASRKDIIKQMSSAIQRANVLAQRPKALKKRKKQLQRHERLLSPIRRMPPEILRAIFLEYHVSMIDELSMWVGDNSIEDNDWYTMEFYNGPLKLGVVCRRWREIVMSWPQLWSFVHLKVVESELDAYWHNHVDARATINALAPFLFEGFRRSQASPDANVFIDLHMDLTDYRSCPEVKVLFDAILPFASRFSSLSLIYKGLEDAENLGSLCPFLPSIRCVRLASDHHEKSFYDLGNSQPFPSVTLERLEFPPPWDWESSRSLTIRRPKDVWREPPQIVPANVFQHLSYLDLSDYHLKMTFHSHRKDFVLFNRLETLAICATHADLLCHITTPSLRSLWLIYETHDATHEEWLSMMSNASALLERSKCAILQLCLKLNVADVMEQVKSLLQLEALAGLEELILHIRPSWCDLHGPGMEYRPSPGLNELFHLLSPSEETDPFCELTELRVSIDWGMQDLDIQEVEAFLPSFMRLVSFRSGLDSTSSDTKDKSDRSLRIRVEFKQRPFQGQRLPAKTIERLLYLRDGKVDFDITQSGL
jgi:hypothetical protein